MYSECARLIEGFPPQMLNDLEVSARKKWQELPFSHFVQSVTQNLTFVRIHCLSALI